MSAYGKPQPPLLHGFDTSRSFPESSFTYAAAPPFASQPPVTTVNTPSYQNVPQMAQVSYTAQSRAPYDDQSGPYLNVGSTPVPQVTSYLPSRGTKGTKIYVYISSLYELMTTSLPTFFLMFGSRRCPSTLSKLEQHGGVCQYLVMADVPAFEATGWSSSPIPVVLLIESGDGELMGRVDVGDFTYVDEKTQGLGGVRVDGSRKRKISTGSAEVMKSPAKRASNHQLRPKEEFAAYGYTSGEGGSFAPYLQPGASYSMMPQYSRGVSNYQPPPASRPMYQYASSSAASPPSLKAQSPQTSWSPFSTVSSHVSQSPAVAGPTIMSRPSLSGLQSPLAANPPLIRTSTLQQTPSPGTTPAVAQSAGQPFNPYALYPHKAVLKIQGDLDGMAESWSEDEWSAKRRIVLFKRSQSGSTITTTFKPIAVDERPPNSVCISCIWWEEKNECFVTSVDTIYLLEQLVAARFTVEEKNRIRRNLEGFRPLTVSKAKEDSEEFFKVIMAFPNPKPRNIEKDVKVFPWKILAHALKKIIGKYSASPSSTLPPALLTPTSSTGYVTESSSSAGYLHGSGEHHSVVSPRSVSRSVSGASTSTMYAANAPSRTLSPLLKQEMNLHGGAPDIHVSLPSYGSHASDATTQWQGSQHHMATSQYQHLSSQNPRASWDLATYLESSPATGAAPGNIPSMGGYDRGITATPASEGEQKMRSTQASQQMPTS